MRKIDRGTENQSGGRRILSIQEFVNFSGIGRTKVYEEMKSGRLRARKIGKRTVILEEDAEKWLRNLPARQSACTANPDHP